MTFARSLLHLRPFLDGLLPVQTEIHNVISQLKADKSADIAEEMDQIDYDLLRVRKKVLPELQEKEQLNLKLQKKLEARE